VTNLQVDAASAAGIAADGPSVPSLDRLFQEACFGQWSRNEVVFCPFGSSDVRTMTYEEIRDRALRVAGSLSRRGLEPGDRIGIALPTSLEALLLFQAAVAAGCVVVPILHLYGDQEIAFIAQAGRLQLLVLEGTRASAVAEVRRKSPDVMVARVGPGLGDVLDFDSLLDGGSPSWPVVPRAAGEAHVIGFTSGTTGIPQGVVHSERTMLATMASIADAFGAGPDDVVFSPNPVGHAAGMICTYYSPFILGHRKVVLAEGWDPDRSVRLIEEHRVSIMGGAPIFLTMMLGCSAFRSADVSSWRACAVGGAEVGPEVVYAADQAGIRCMRTYGLTEHPCVTMGRAGDDLDLRASTDGRSTLNSEIQVVDDNGALLPPGSPGEIVVRGGGRCIARLSSDDLHYDRLESDEWLRTGDVGTISSDGYLRVLDRKKDIIIRGGENISAREVEGHLLQHPDVEDVAVVAVPDARSGEQVCAFVVPRAGTHPTLPGLTAFWRSQRLPMYKAPRYLVAVPSLPKTLAGKVQKYRLREEFLAAAQGDAHALD
jgi:cyclohexanecarboxylate-CoA ligase